MSEQLRGCSALTRACARRRVTSLNQRPCRVVRASATVLCCRRDPERRSPTRRVFRIELADSDHPPDPERRAPRHRMSGQGTSRPQPTHDLGGNIQFTTEKSEADQERTGLLAGFHDVRRYEMARAVILSERGVSLNLRYLRCLLLLPGSSGLTGAGSETGAPIGALARVLTTGHQPSTGERVL
jgi:hypothetical protein